MRILTLLLLLSCCATDLTAEARLQVLYRDKYYDVESTRDNIPLILVDGALRSAKDCKMRLAEVGYGNATMQTSPKWAYMTVRKQGTTSVEIDAAPGSKINNELHLLYTVTATEDLPNVFAVASIQTERAGAGYMVRTMGNLRRQEPVTLNFSTWLSHFPGDGTVRIFLFTNGREIRHSLSRDSDFSYGLESGSRERSRAEQTQAPHLFWSYPPLGLKSGADQAEMVLEFENNGAVTRAKVVSPLPPGEAALLEKVVKQWWFVPTIEGRRQRAGGVRCVIRWRDVTSWPQSAIEMLDHWVVPIDPVRPYHPTPSFVVPETLTMGSTKALSESLRAQHASGSCRVLFTIAKSGTPVTLRIEGRSDAVLSHLSLEFVEQMRFAPPQNHDGSPCEVKVDISAD